MLECFGNGPEVVTAIDIPLDKIALSLWEIRLVTMLLRDGSALLIAANLVLFIVSVLLVELN